MSRRLGSIGALLAVVLLVSCTDSATPTNPDREPAAMPPARASAGENLSINSFFGFPFADTANTPSTGVAAWQLFQAGTGVLSNFTILNSTNPSSAVIATTLGTGNGILAINNGAGGTAGAFTVNGASNPATAIQVGTQGTGNALNASIINSASTAQVIKATSSGLGFVAFLQNTNPSNTAPTLKVFNSGPGVAGEFSGLNPASSAPTLFASTNGTGDALKAQTSGSGFAARFFALGPTGRGVLVSTNGGAGLQVIGGSKNAVVATSSGARALHAEEAAEVWFTDYGFGQLTRGRAHLTIDPTFAETVRLDLPYHVFLQPYGPAQLYVENRGVNGFEVVARDGAQNAEFSWRLVATRRGFEGRRLDRAPWADHDPNLR